VVKVFDISDSTLESCALHEISVLKQLDHPLIVKMVDSLVVRENQKAYLVLEYAGDDSLLTYVRRKGKLSEDVARGIVR
jgi:serine/threonine protein kinase